jgi:hypothetical protein
MWGVGGHGKHHINLTIIQPIKTFRTHNFTYLLCWDVKPILYVSGHFTDCVKLYENLRLQVGDVSCQMRTTQNFQRLLRI